MNESPVSRWSLAQQRLLLIAAHADDEVLGAGGTLAAAARTGAAVHAVVLSVASSSRDVDESARQRLETHRLEAARAAAALGGWSLTLHELPDNAFDSLRSLDIAKLIEHDVAAFAPTAVLTHYPGDLSRDHQITATAVATAIRPNARGAPAVLAFFEIRSSTEWTVSTSCGPFRPSIWIPLAAADWQVKQRALACYTDELRPSPHPRSPSGVEALARYRGSEVGVAMAEAFVLARAVVGNPADPPCSP